MAASLDRKISPSDSIYAIGHRLIEISEEECLANFELDLEMLRVDLEQICTRFRLARMRGETP